MSSDNRGPRCLLGKRDAARRMAGRVNDLEGTVAEIDMIAFIKHRGGGAGMIP